MPVTLAEAWSFDVLKEIVLHVGYCSLDRLSLPHSIGLLDLRALAATAAGTEVKHRSIDFTAVCVHLQPENSSCIVLDLPLLGFLGSSSPTYLLIFHLCADHRL